MALNDGERLKGLRLAQCKLALFQLILSLEQSHYVINRGRIDKFLNIRAPRKLLSGLDSGGIMAIITQSDVNATVGQRGFWDEQQRVSKLQEKKPVLKRLSESIPWESFRPLLDQGYVGLAELSFTGLRTYRGQYAG
jgi:hypothetical protein